MSEPINASALVDSLDRFAVVLPAVMASFHPGELKWKPSEKDWSPLEILCHLADEEVEDFRPRVHLALARGEGELLKIDPAGWVTSRAYNEQDPQKVLSRFVAERRASVARLRALQSPDWAAALIHPKIGELRAGDFLVSWVAHDALHLRQLARRQFQLANHHAPNFSSLYAGEW